MRGFSFRIALSSLLYIVASLLDTSFTYIYVVKLGIYAEANPFMAPIIFNYPPYIPFLLDLSTLMVVLASTLAYKRLAQCLGCINIAYRSWLIPAIICIARFLPVIHNFILISTGYETPLPQLIRHLWNH